MFIYSVLFPKRPLLQLTAMFYIVRHRQYREVSLPPKEEKTSLKHKYRAAHYIPLI